MKTISATKKINDRMRGAYSTPDILAQFLVSWAIRNPSDLIIDPCCGDGVFLEAIANRLLFLGGNASAIKQITGVEIDPLIANESYDRLFKLFQVEPKIIPKGFFETLPSLQREYYDVVVGNPPFVRYRHYLKDERELALRFLQEEGFKASKMISVWVPFLVAAIHLLKPKGRLAMVMPAELFQVSYAADIREYLLNNFGFLFVVTFNNLVFPEVQQEIILLMGTKGEGKGLRLIEIKDESELAHVPHLKNPQIPIDDSKEKWTQYYLNDAQRKVLREGLDHDAIHKLEQFCSVDVGVVTGRNNFFLLPPKIALQLDAKNHLTPIVTRTKYLRGLNFTENDWQENVSNNHPSYLLEIKSEFEISNNLKQYILSGEDAGWNEGYKCRNRKLWYVVPSVWTPDAFLYRQIGSFPRLVLNSANVTCTDSLHRVKFKNKKLGKMIACCFHNSLTYAFSELFGRSYGGGVLELMPTEAEKLPIPISKSDSTSLFSEIEGLLREGLLDEAIELVDIRVLNEELGFKKENITLIRSAWKDLSKRRKSRKRRKAYV